MAARPTCSGFRVPAAEDIAALVERAYEVFPTQRLTGLGVCNCGICMSDAEQARVAARERREITTEDLRAWYDAAASDSGLVPRSVAEHLAPRVLHMVAENEDVFELEVAFRRFAFGDPDHWLGDQRALLDAFRDAYLDRLPLRHARRGTLLDDALCLLALGRFDLDTIFQQIEAWPPADLINRLWCDWCGWGRHGVWRTSVLDAHGGEREGLASRGGSGHGGLVQARGTGRA